MTIKYNKNNWSLVVTVPDRNAAIKEVTTKLNRDKDYIAVPAVGTDKKICYEIYSRVASPIIIE